MFVDHFIAEWNSQNPDRIVACYAEDCLYQDPDTRGPIQGRDGLRRYLGRVFSGFNLSWTLRESHPLTGTDGFALLWKVQIVPKAGGETKTLEAMELVVLRNGLVARNEVFYGRR